MTLDMCACAELRRCIVALGNMTEAELYFSYKGVYVPKLIHSPESFSFLENFPFRHDDILVVTYPKSGTTWSQEILPLIISDGDMTPVLTIPNWDRMPWLEEHRALKLNLEQRPSPRLFVTHCHYYMMPESFFKVKPKVIYIMRNPKDVFTSSYPFYAMASYMVNPGTKDEFLEKFLDGTVIFGSWFDHVKGWLGAKDQVNIMYISYEEMILDLRASITKISHFVGKSLTQEVTEKIADHCMFTNMKQNKMSNYSLVSSEILDQKKSEFLRKGVIGDWKNCLTEDQVARFDSVYKERMKDVNFKFIWDEDTQL
ncbi:sulfotransferase family cytosolic 2B member 1-like [Arapaima gigas]